MCIQPDMVVSSCLFYIQKCQLEASLFHLISIASISACRLLGPPVFSKSWRFQALLPDCSQSPWPQAKLPEVILCSWQPAETSLSKTSCISSEECALHCLTRAGASLGPPPPHLSLRARAWQPYYLPVSSRHTSPGLRLQDEAQTLEVS